MNIGTKQKKQEIVIAVAKHLLKEGFRNNTLKAMAKSVGISDRMVMYYFENKEILLTEALFLISDHLISYLETALSARQASGEKIVAAVLDSAQLDETKPLQMLWFEIVGLAVRGDEPYKAVARLMLERYEEWIRSKLSAKHKHRAPALVAKIQGEMMIGLLTD